MFDPEPRRLRDSETDDSAEENVSRGTGRAPQRMNQEKEASSARELRYQLVGSDHNIPTYSLFLVILPCPPSGRA